MRTKRLCYYSCEIVLAEQWQTNLYGCENMFAHVEMHPLCRNAPRLKRKSSLQPVGALSQPGQPFGGSSACDAAWTW